MLSERMTGHTNTVTQIQSSYSSVFLSKKVNSGFGQYLEDQEKSIIAPNQG